MATWNMYSFQDPNSFISLMLIWLHDYNMMLLISTMLLISYFIFNLFYNKFTSRNILHGNMLEIIWTLLPMVVLFDMAIPSLKVLYYMENMQLFMYTVKSIGHQWYWSYEYFDNNFMVMYDSYMINTIDLPKSGFRLLEVDNRLVLPNMVPVRNVVTSSDVIHSWAVPSLGLKIDAVPGRLNQISLYSLRSGVYYGQCSEICGMNHSFMPIVLELTDEKSFKSWLMFMNK
uniref:Cytochrome c oxidase subunit 2 n=1 Tax=Agenioideus sp. SJW-2017 TaxID=1940100 RepID=A0A1P8VH71_9HYME|nr:cytochrome c oxidase subunit 2 [Agenioideus sp. SJW-2017]